MDVESNENSKLQSEIIALKNEIAQKNDTIKQFELSAARYQNEISELNKVISNLNSNVGNLKNESIQEDISHEEDDFDFDIDERMERYLKTIGLGMENHFYIHAINPIMAILHKSSSMDTEQWNFFSLERAEHFAYLCGLEFYLNIQKAKKPPILENLPYPISWFLSQFPCTWSPSSSESERSKWLPLYWLLSADAMQSVSSSSSSSDVRVSDYDSQQESGESYLKVLKILLDHYGEAAWELDVSPLSVAVAKNRPWLSAVKAILDFSPDAASFMDEDGSLPIMHACASNNNREVVEYLHSLYPEGFDKEDNFGCKCIHYAAYRGNFDVVKFLLETNIACAQYVEGNGAFPLHDAAQNTFCVDFHQADTIDESSTLDSGNPSHDGAKIQSGGSAIVKLLLDTYPLATSKRDMDGALPLHHAARSANLDTIKLICDAFPEAVFVADNEGLLPMHYAAERSSQNAGVLQLVQYILELNMNGKIKASDEETTKKLYDSSVIHKSNAHRGNEDKSSAGTSSASSFLSSWGFTQKKNLPSAADTSLPPASSVVSTSSPVAMPPKSISPVNVPHVEQQRPMMSQKPGGGRRRSVLQPGTAAVTAERRRSQIKHISRRKESPTFHEEM